MKQLKPILALLLALALILPLSGLALAEDFPAETGSLAEDYTGKTVILQTNDVHGAVDGYAYAAQMKKDLASRGAEVILVDAGDYFQGTPYVSFSKGASAVAMMNAAGYDLATLGNHEFDYGFDQLEENLADAQFKVLCANIFRDGQQVFDGNVIIEKGGMKIGFFGLNTPEAQTKTNPAVIRGVEVLNNSNGKNDLNDCAAAQVAALQSAGADLIVGLWHLGMYDESAADGHRSVDLATKIAGIDIVIDGHSHNVMTAGKNGENVLSSGTKFANIGLIVIDNATKTVEDRFLVPCEGLEKDPEVAALAEGIMSEIDALYGVPFARSEVALNGARAPEGNRDSETNNGNLITDAMLWRVRKEGALEVPDENVVVVTNGGGIRAGIEPGEISMKDVNTVLPFANTVYVVYVSGAELLETLEASTFALVVGGFPQTAGIQWTLDTTKVYDARSETYPASSYYGPASIQRVTIRSVNGQPFDETATYAVVTNNFCGGGGDTYYALSAASAKFDTGIPLDEAVVDYIQSELGGVIGEKYAFPRGDLVKITIENTEAQATAQSLLLDGEEITGAEVYNINGENYFKLRDVAALLSGTQARFEIAYDAETREIAVETGKAYTPVGGELEAHADRSASIAVSSQPLTVDGAKANLTAFNLEGNNFFRLKDLGRVLGFDVAYDAEANAMTVTTAAAEAA